MQKARFPVKTYRGTFAEVLAHSDEIPADSLVEMQVFAAAPADEISLSESLAVLIDEANVTEKGTPITYTKTAKQAMLEAVKEKFKRQGFSE